MHYEEMFPSRFMKVQDIPAQGVTVVLASIDGETLGQELKYVTTFENHQKQLVLDKTNAKRIARLHGNNTNQWIGKRVKLVPEAVDFKGDFVQRVRVSLNKPHRPQVRAGAADDAENLPF